MHAHSTSATNPRNHHFSLHQKFKINRPFHPLFLWQLSIKFVTHRHEENTCMRMNLPNPRFFFPPFIHSSWVTCLDYSMTCSSSYLFCWVCNHVNHVLTASHYQQANKFTWMGISWGADTCFFGGVVYLGTSSFGFSAWVLVWIILLVFQREVLI